MTVPTNLNTFPIPADCSRRPKLANPSTNAEMVDVHFRNIENALCAHINKADAVIGCVAWLTSVPVLRALALKKKVALVVNKEDWLRPDIGQSRMQYQRTLYDDLSGNFTRYEFPFLAHMSCACGYPIEPVRCVGVINNGQKIPSPRMHHKFVVFGHLTEEEYPYFLPYAVWTGSFNFTKTAGYSLENAVVIREPAIVKAYVSEWEQVMALSEPLNWNATWVEPEWRIGT